MPDDASVPRRSRHYRDPELLALGHRLRGLRADAGLTQEALAEASELHWTYIGQIERGERNLTYLNILALARGLGVSPSLLVDSD